MQPTTTLLHTTCSDKVRFNLQRVLDNLSSNTVMVFLTGSQACGTATPESDIDLYLVVRGDKWERQHLAPSMTPDKLGLNMKVDVTVNTIQEACKRIRKYGCFHYWAVRNGILLYDDGSRESETIHDIIHQEVSVPESAALWLENANNLITTITTRNTKYGDVECEMVDLRVCTQAIQACLSVALLRAGIMFGQRRTTMQLAALLPDDTLVYGIDLERADGWFPRTNTITDCDGEYAVGVQMVNTIRERLKEDVSI